MSFKQVRSLFPKSIDFSKCPSLTRQEFAASADMNFIVSKFLRTGQIDFPNASRPMVDGLEYPNDFTEACNLAFEQRQMEIALHENESASNRTESSVENDLQSLSKGTSRQVSTSGDKDGSGDGSVPKGE